MRTSFACPVCSADRWCPLGHRTYTVGEGGVAPVAGTDDYTRLRMEVLFKVWFPGETAVTMVIQACALCGLVVYSPRPDAADLDRKYAYLNLPGKSSQAGLSAVCESKRARGMYSRIARRVKIQPGLRVLDYGGGDGRLMRLVADAGASCFVVDYNERVVPGIARIGSTLQDLDSRTEPFDVCVLSHVLEHVAEPVDLVRGLRGFMAPGGLVYGEVPLECWRGLPQLSEPVTHVNFFTPHSLSQVFLRAGYRVESCGILEYITDSQDGTALGIGVWARVDETAATAVFGCCESDLDVYLDPSPIMILRVALRAPCRAWRHFGDRLARGLGRVSRKASFR